MRLLLPQLHRRVRRLLPPGLRTVGVLPPPAPSCWETSPLSCLPLGGGRRGTLGLRLDAGVAAAIRARGLEALRDCTEGAGVPAMMSWRCLPGRPFGFCACRDDGALACLLDASAAAVWLLWQVPAPGRAGRCC